MAKLSLAAAGMLAATFSSAQGSYGTETISDPYGNTVTVGPILDTVSAYDYGRSLGVREDILDMTDAYFSDVSIREISGVVAAINRGDGRIIIDPDVAIDPDYFIHELAHNQYGYNCKHTAFTERLLRMQHGRSVPDTDPHCR